MNNGMLLIGLMLAGLFLFRRQPQTWDQTSWTGGPGTGYGIDIWGDEG